MEVSNALLFSKIRIVANKLSYFKETFLLFISVKDFINPENYFL